MQNSLAGSYDDTKNTVDIINNFTSYLRQANGTAITKKVQVPVAVVLTKFDTILSHKSFFQNALIRQPSLNLKDGKVNIKEINQIDEEIKNWLYEIGEGSFIEALKSNFKEFVFFGVSSYGEPPVGTDTLNNYIKPHRILDPILWIFKKLDFIK